MEEESNKVCFTYLIQEFAFVTSKGKVTGCSTLKQKKHPKFGSRN